MFETITKWFTQLAEKMTADQIGYTLLGALGLVFVMSLIVALASRERRKFRKGARRLIAAEGKNAAACIRTFLLTIYQYPLSQRRRHPGKHFPDRPWWFRE